MTKHGCSMQAYTLYISFITNNLQCMCEHFIGTLLAFLFLTTCGDELIFFMIYMTKACRLRHCREQYYIVLEVLVYIYSYCILPHFLISGVLNLICWFKVHIQLAYSLTRADYFFLFC